MNNWQRAILHLDMDAFFVNVYLLDHPEDRGVPLAVGGQPDSRGVVASASYEARQLGIHSAMPMKTAVRLCRNLRIVPADWDQIKKSSKQVIEILRGYGTTEQISVDEAFVDLSDFDDPPQTAIALREHVTRETRLPCSVGLASSKLVAKVSSDFDKPAGCTIVAPGDEARFLAPLPVRAIWGIGARTAERLNSIGITACGELATVSLDKLRIMGNQAESLQRRAQGIDNRPIQAERGQSKSISQEWTFSADISDPQILTNKIEEMSKQVSRSLTRQKLVAKTVVVKFRWSDFTTFTRQRSVTMPIQDSAEIYTLARAIWQDNWPAGTPMRLIGVGVSNLDDKTALRQLPLNFDGL